jgi:hypothetical protein
MPKSGIDSGDNELNESLALINEKLADITRILGELAAKLDDTSLWRAYMAGFYERSRDTDGSWLP